MSAVDPNLRLSTQRALLGAIHSKMRLIKVKRDGAVIALTTIAAEPLSDEARDALSVAAAEIIADFPACRIEERVVISGEPLPMENVLAEGWVYQRAEQ